MHTTDEGGPPGSHDPGPGEVETVLLNRARDGARRITMRVLKTLEDTATHAALPTDPTEEAPPLQSEPGWVDPEFAPVADDRLAQNPLPTHPSPPSGHRPEEGPMGERKNQTGRDPAAGLAGLGHGGSHDYRGDVPATRAAETGTWSYR